MPEHSVHCWKCINILVRRICRTSAINMIKIHEWLKVTPFITHPIFALFRVILISSIYGLKNYGCKMPVYSDPGISNNIESKLARHRKWIGLHYLEYEHYVFIFIWSQFASIGFSRHSRRTNQAMWSCHQSFLVQLAPLLLKLWKLNVFTRGIFRSLLLCGITTLLIY